MADGKLGIPNDISNIILGLSGSGLAGYLGVAATTAGQVVGLLPIVGIAASLLDLWYAKQQYDEREEWRDFSFDEKEKQGFFSCWSEQGSIVTRSISAMLLLIASLDVLLETHTFILGARGCSLLPLIYTVKSAVDFVDACASLSVIIKKENGIKSQEGKAACANVLAQVMTFAGWTFLACGNPLGWMFLAATIVPHAARLWYGVGFFGKKPQSNVKLSIEEHYSRGEFSLFMA